MIRLVRTIEELTSDDLAKYPIWAYTNSHEEASELAVSPVLESPVRSPLNRVVGSEVQLANGSRYWAILSDLDLNDPFWNLHFLGITLFIGAERFHLARCHDFFFDTNGPIQLAQSLALKIEEGFPIRYDISAFCVGQKSCVYGEIPFEIPQKLTEEEKMEAIFARTCKMLRGH